MDHWRQQMAVGTVYGCNGHSHWIGVHDPNARFQPVYEKTWDPDIGQMVMHYTIHVEYTDYMDCAKCGERVMANDTPETWAELPYRPDLPFGQDL